MAVAKEVVGSRGAPTCNLTPACRKTAEASRREWAGVPQSQGFRDYTRPRLPEPPCQPSRDSLCQWLNPESEEEARVSGVQPRPAAKQSTRQEPPTARKQSSSPDDQTHVQSN